MKECPRCSLPAPDAEQYCQECGAELTLVPSGDEHPSPNASQKCRACSAEIKAAAKFCHDCGASQSPTPTAAQTIVLPKVRPDAILKSAPVPSPPEAKKPEATRAAASVSTPPAQTLAAGKARINRKVVRSASVVAAALLLLAAAGWWFAGTALAISTNPPAATVLLNGKPIGASGPDGALRISRLVRGAHRIRVERAGYQAVEQPVLIGWFAVRESAVTVTLPSASATLTLMVVAKDTEVLIDDVKADIAVADIGRIVVPHAPLGRHVIEVRRPGSFTWHDTLTIDGAAVLEPKLQPDFTGEWSGAVSSGSSFRLPINLAIEHQPNSLLVSNVSPSGARFPMDNASASGAELAFAFGTMEFAGTLSPDGQVLSGRVGGQVDATWTAARRAAPGTSLDVSPTDDADAFVTKAKDLFQRREYRRALDASEQALRLRPDHSPALKLKEQIEQTINILGIPQ